MHSSTGRHSRASSIISTRTKFSTTTLDDARSDARSIDIHVGGQYFRISRDGAHITDELPPPYTDPNTMSRLSSPDLISTRSSSISQFRGGRSRGSSVSDALYGENEDETDNNLTVFEGSPDSVQADVMPLPDSDTSSSADDIVRSSGDTDRTTVQGTERSEHNSFHSAGPEVRSLPAGGRSQRTVSENNLPRFDSPGPTTQIRRAATLTSPVAVRSAGLMFSSTKERNLPELPLTRSRNADAPHLTPAQLGRGLIHNIADSATRTFPDTTEHGPEEELTTPLAMDSENDISLHYARLMRSLDRDHRRALHLKDKELEKLRERINEVDTVYRQELRARDFMIDDLKKRLDHLEETQESRIEKARNEVEDVWESRWKNRDTHIQQRMRRLEEEARRTLEGRVQA